MTIVKTASPFLPLPDCSKATDDDYINTCEAFYRKLIACRVYFAIMIINSIFVIATTVYYIAQSISAIRHSSTDQDVSKRWRCYSLRKRSLFGSVLGAIGHFCFCTITFICQVITNTDTCEIYIWGPAIGLYIWIYAIIWRSIRLYTLMQISDLQQKLLDHPFESKNSSSFKWFMRRKKWLKMSTRSHFFIFMSTIFFIAVIIILVETLCIRQNGILNCNPDWGNRLMIGIVAFFFCVILPTILWFLRGCDDAHGLRLELWVTAIVGLPFIVLFLVWQMVFPSPMVSPASMRNIFMTTNWIMIITTVNHFMSIILPVFKVLCIGEIETRTTNMIENACHRFVHKLHNWYEKISFLGSAHSVYRPYFLTRNNLEITNESLLMVLCDGEMRQILRNWAIKDFTVENILFYETYLGLVDKVRHLHYYKRSSKPNSFQSSRKLSISNIPLAPNIAYYPPSEHQVEIPSHNRNISPPTHEDLSRKFRIDEIPEVVQFYETFISEYAPLQVNISYKARGTIDAIFKKDGKSNLKKTRVSTPDIFSYEMIETVTQPLKGEISNSVDRERISLSIFDEATKEVFWNIFTGLYPKVVDYFNKS
ncbi:hypothetical protein K501DRAFT_183320 [Backusella circina FSU 941]|nr:hypothetical protein K501DRAFT_183320 [Backusella circina FSU 941]